ncbi:protoporphyrinogen oxidase, partial [Nematolebias whitei]|uniref:protoporphyrinogen oxidase n=1 Tax=Nematolebias whitei TaxID=451745 RepID=UPI00189B230E
MKTIAVLGGGIGGLAATYYLCKSPQVTKVIVLESTSRFGGWLWSSRRSDGAVFEHGPRGIRPVGPVGHNTLNMVEDLGLEGEILPVSYSHDASKNRYLYVRGQLHRLPSGISGIFRTVPPFPRPLLFNMATEILVKKGKEEDESIHSFVSRRLGKELADIAVDSLCRGVFAGDSRKLSVRSCFPPFYKAEQKRGSLTLGFLLGSGPTPTVSPGPLAQRSMEESWAQWSLRRGMESLPESISVYLQQSGKVQLHREAAVKQIKPSSSGWKVHLEDGLVFADHIISALPAKALSSVLPISCQTLIQLLQDISAVTVAVVNLEYDGSILPVKGFGHLIPSSEDPGVLGVVYDSVFFPQHNRPNGETTRLTVMMGGAWFQEEFGAPEAVTP